MQKFLRNFTLITFVAVAVVLFVLASIYRHAMDMQIIEAAQEESLTFARVLGVTIKENTHALSDMQSMDREKFRQSPSFTTVDTLIRRYATGSKVLQVNVYQINGIAIYSTSVSFQKLNAASSTAYKLALSGQKSSELVYVNHFDSLSGTAVYRDAVSSYIPVNWSGDGKIDVIVQIYTDVTGRLAAIQKVHTRLYIYSGLLLFGMIIVLLIMLKTTAMDIQLHDNKITQQQQELHHYAYRDTLTGLPNRGLFKDRLEHAVHWACQHERLLAVLAIDLDRFKYINDNFGFSAGDELLVQVAERLNKCIHDYDTLSRIGGGSFAIVLEDLSVVDEAAEAANHIFDLMSAPFLIQEQEVFVTLSIGIALYPFDDEKVESIMQKSDTALYQAKEAGRNTYRFYSSRKRDKAVTRFALGNALRHAIERDEFKIYYQPIVQLSNGRIIGVEALLRWHLPSQGIIPPLEFISVLEESGLIIPVGKWVLETACNQGKAWKRQGFGDLKININISAKQFSDSNLLQYVNDALDRSKYPPHLLNLEITESLLIENRERVIQVLDQLNERGVSMSIDDFGTGYSSMAYLKNMPIETIKIDKTFVQGIPYDMDDVAIIHAIDYLSKNLRLDVIAEGVETTAQMDFLRKLNVFAIQGYLVSRPVPAAELENLFRQHDPAQYKT